MTSYRLRYCKATIDNMENGTFMLWSYNSLVAEVDTCKKIITFYPKYRYGSTTMQHVRKFLIDIIGFYVPMGIVDDIIKGKIDNLYKGYHIEFNTKVH